jgi:TolB-like protein/cytochrome c-type biogenesis protein CcmH/NrfG
MPEATKAIFLSYASQDADSARLICEALRAAGLEVWFDQSELRGGDAWDASIRKQVRECALFVPVISANTNERSEGYFRLEWKLAVDRSHLMADDQAFLMPVVIDDTPEPLARVPDRFRERQWSRLASEGAIAAFAARVSMMMSERAHPHPSPAASRATAEVIAPGSDSPSIAVLAFANRSNDPNDEYFSDGLADELLNVLAKIRGLRVAARTSAFSFKGKQATVAEIGRALNVATVLDGSVRKAGNRIRIMVQLVKVSDGYHLWSETYDRTLDDVFAVQDDIAQSVVKELRATLMGEAPIPKQHASVGDEIAAAAKGRSASSEANRLLLQGRHLADRLSGPDFARSIDYLRQAVAVDPGFALAWAWLALALTQAAGLGYAQVKEGNAEALQAARRALELEPDLVEGHLSLCWHKAMHEWDWKGAEISVRRALQLAPNNADALSAATMLSYNLGRLQESVDFGRRSVEQDPLNPKSHTHLGRPLAALGLLSEAEQAYRKALELSPEGVAFRLLLALTLQRQGRHDEAIAEAMQERAPWARLTALAILHFIGGQVAEADQALQELLETCADTSAYQIAQAYAVRGNADAAFAWLERGYAQRDSGLGVMKPSWVFKPIHGDPRWSAFIERMGLAN